MRSSFTIRYVLNTVPHKLSKELLPNKGNTALTGFGTRSGYHLSIPNPKNLLIALTAMLQRFENGLHSFVAYFIMPVFALANAGVVFISLSSVSDSNFSLSVSLAESMVFGKIVGISLFSWLAIKTKIATLPKGISFKHIVGVSILGGFGFTMSLFIESLAYTDVDLLASGKIGILVGSILAGIIGYIVLRMTLPVPKVES